MNNVYFEEEFLTDRQRKNLAILDLLRRSRVTTKTDISKNSKLNIVTVSNYVNEFTKNGLVLEREQGVSTGGRRPILLELNAKYGYAIGLGMNMYTMVGVIIDIRGNIIAKVKEQEWICEQPGLNIMLDMIENLIDSDLMSRYLDLSDRVCRFDPRESDGFDYEPFYSLENMKTEHLKNFTFLETQLDADFNRDDVCECDCEGGIYLKIDERGFNSLFDAFLSISQDEKFVGWISDIILNARDELDSEALSHTTNNAAEIAKSAAEDFEEYCRELDENE